MRSILNLRTAALLLALALAPAAPAAGAPADGIALISPAELAGTLSAKGPRPLLLQVGYRVLYRQQHIPGSELVGPASTPEGLDQLRRRVQSLPRDALVVLYCGCCPWSQCPNVRPAWDALRAMGFTNVKVLHVADNFAADWASRGYPVARGD